MASQKIFYLIQTTEDIPLSGEWLSEAERTRSEALRFPKRRKDWILGRWTAKNAVREFLSLRGPSVPDLPEIEIRGAADGAPEAYLCGFPAAFSISLSHSGDFSLAAVGDTPSPVGCDLEIIQPRIAQFIEDYLIEEERALLAEAPAADHPFLSTLIWCGKECALKCLREGLRRDTRSVQVRSWNASGDDWRTISIRCLETAQIFCGWWRQENGLIQSIAAMQAVAEPIELQRRSPGV
jgi:4'-phosphopantetheinyl transferase